MYVIRFAGCFTILEYSEILNFSVRQCVAYHSKYVKSHSYVKVRIGRVKLQTQKYASLTIIGYPYSRMSIILFYQTCPIALDKEALFYFIRPILSVWTHCPIQTYFIRFDGLSFSVLFYHIRRIILFYQIQIISMKQDMNQCTFTKRLHTYHWSDTGVCRCDVSGIPQVSSK